MLSSAAIKQRAAELGFDLCGISAADSFPELRFLPEWLSRGYAGEMQYMEKSAHTRADIRNFLPSAKSVIVTGTIYNTDQGSGTRDRGSVKVARYARGEDYHVVLYQRLESLLAWMREHTDRTFEAEIFCDKHHVQERVYAQH